MKRIVAKFNSPGSLIWYLFLKNKGYKININAENERNVAIQFFRKIDKTNATIIEISKKIDKRR